MQSHETLQLLLSHLRDQMASCDSILERAQFFDPRAEPWFITYLNALSTFAVALFAGVEVWRLRREHLDRARLASVRIATRAERLRAIVADWIEHCPFAQSFREGKSHDAQLQDVADQCARDPLAAVDWIQQVSSRLQQADELI
jgi:hypothetical protein